MIRGPWQTALESVTSLLMESESFTTVMLATNFKDLSLESVKLMVSGQAQLLVVLVRITKCLLFFQQLMHDYARFMI